MHIVSKAPLRISLAGGGTDLPNYYEKYGGIVISMAINLRSKVEFFTKEDKWGQRSADFPFNANPDLYYSILNSMGVGGRHRACSTTSCDGIIGAGLGSSASFSVALISAIKKSKRERIDRNEVAELAWQAEKEIGRISGKQDQYAAAYGGFNVILFGKKIDVLPYDKQVTDHVLSYMNLFYIGGTRDSSDLQKNIQNPTEEQLVYLEKIKDSAIIAQKAILDGKMDIVAKLLNFSWDLKKQLNPKVSNKKIDKIYDYAKKNGAMAGKICGAGSCGYLIFLVSPERQDDFLKAMKKKNLHATDFSVSYDGLDVKIV